MLEFRESIKFCKDMFVGVFICLQAYRIMQILLYCHEVYEFDNSFIQTYIAVTSFPEWAI